MIAPSIAPLEVMNLSADAPARLEPLRVNVTVAPRAMPPGEMLEINGPVVTETNWLKMLGAVPEANPNRTDSIGLRKGTGVLITTPRRTYQSRRAVRLQRVACLTRPKSDRGPPVVGIENPYWPRQTEVAEQR